MRSRNEKTVSVPLQLSKRSYDHHDDEKKTRSDECLDTIRSLFEGMICFIPNLIQISSDA
jgi:hypothetical protein